MADDLNTFLDETFAVVDRAVAGHRTELKAEEVGVVRYVGHGIAIVNGLPRVQSEEVVRFPGDLLGMAFNLDPDQVGVILLDESERVRANDEVRRTKRVLDVPVGPDLLGRVIDAVGRPLDGRGRPRAEKRLPVERPAAGILERAPVTVPLQTGLKVVDALIPIGRGQRELILGDRQTGKTAVAVDTIINQKGQDVVCVYCAVGQQSSSVAKVIADLKAHGAMPYCVVVVAGGDDPPGLQYVAPYAAMTIAEYFRDRGQDALVVFDDLTRHARAYRELSLLLRRPPGREAYPGDIFYIHSRLLERATHLRQELGGGSVTALPIIETEAENMAAYIPTNLISITDGQIYLRPNLFRKGIVPAVDVGRSVSRVGGKTQLRAYRAVAGDLRLSYAQFEELEVFSRFGTRLDQQTRQTLERGYRVREVFKQPQYEPVPVAQQIAVLLAVNEGVFDDLPEDQIAEAEIRVRQAVVERLSEVCRRIETGRQLDDHDRDQLVQIAGQAIASRQDEGPRVQNEA